MAERFKASSLELKGSEVRSLWDIRLLKLLITPVSIGSFVGALQEGQDPYREQLIRIRRGYRG